MKKFIISAALMGVLGISAVGFGGCAPAADAVEEAQATPIVKEEVLNPNDFKTDFIKANGIELFSATAMTASEDGSYVEQFITATVLPEYAFNKEVDWSIAWEDSSKTETVTDYVTVTPEADGSTTASVKCYQGFTGKITITVTTRSGGHTADCTVTFRGFPSEIEITTDLAMNENSGYDLWLGEVYTFNVNLSNEFNRVGDDFYNNIEIESYANGSIKVKTETKKTSPTYIGVPTTEQSVLELDSLKNDLINVTYANGVISLEVKTAIDSYQKYWEETEGEYTLKKERKFDSYVGSKEDCYFDIKATEPETGIETSFRFWIKKADSPTEIGITTDLAMNENGGYDLLSGNVYTFNVNLSNANNRVGEDFYNNISVESYANGSINAEITTVKSPTFTIGDSTETKKQSVLEVNSFKNDLINITYANGVITLNVKKTIKNYSKTETDYGLGDYTLTTTTRFKSYVETEEDCYFNITVTEPETGLETSFRFWIKAV